MTTFKDILLESFEKRNLKEAVAAPYVGQKLNSIGKERGTDFTVTFVNNKIVKVKMPNGKEQTFDRDKFTNEFSLAGEVSESVEMSNEGIFSVDFSVADPSGEEVAKILRDVADMLDEGETEGVITDEDDNEIGSFCFQCGEEDEKGDDEEEDSDEEDGKDVDVDVSVEEGSFNDDGSYNTSDDEANDFDEYEDEEENKTMKKK